MTGFVPAAIKPTVAMADLDKLDIRIGMIEKVESVAGSEKLVKLTVDIGDRCRTVLAGLRTERADPKAEMEGRQALCVVAPRRMAGHVSEAISATPTASRPFSPCQNGQCRTARERASGGSQVSHRHSHEIG
jgi:tRNA-binding protein